MCVFAVWRVCFCVVVRGVVFVVSLVVLWCVCVLVGVARVSRLREWCIGYVVVLVGPPPVLAVGLGRSFSPPFLVWVCCWRWGRFFANSDLGFWVQFPPTPGWGLLVVLAAGPSQILAEGPGWGLRPFLARVC